MRALPVLEERRSSLEKCVFCPKLCRTACPVSNAEPRETITPWGKMSVAWMAAHGDVPVDRSHAAPAWACTGCYACRELCDHRNPVADVLLDARAAFQSRGVAPEGARRVVDRFARHDEEARALARGLLARETGAVGIAGDVRARTALLVGCGYLRHAPTEAMHAVEAAAIVAGRPAYAGLALVDACCGLPLRMAGDFDGFRAHARSVVRSLEASGVERVLVADAGCALALRRRYPDAGVDLPPGVNVEPLVAAVARWLSSRRAPPERGAPHSGERIRALSAADEDGSTGRDESVFWHDPCALGRGLGVYDAPRLVLARALGRPPGELPSAREHALCSGAGGLLPSTMPDVARAIARTRIEEAESAGADHVVTGCASSLIALRRAAAPSQKLVLSDIVTWLVRAIHAD
jgi:Fe-S oxidoreductase